MRKGKGQPSHEDINSTMRMSVCLQADSGCIFIDLRGIRESSQGNGLYYHLIALLLAPLPSPLTRAVYFTFLILIQSMITSFSSATSDGLNSQNRFRAYKYPPSSALRFKPIIEDYTFDMPLVFSLTFRDTTDCYNFLDLRNSLKKYYAAFYARWE